MHQPSESRRYHLFPGKDKLSIPAGRKSPDAETVLSSTLGHIDKDRPVMGIAIRTKPKDQFLIRRKKVNVPDLGTMTTVQEIAMDSRKSVSSQGIRYGQTNNLSSNHPWPPTSTRAINQCTREQLASTNVWRESAVFRFRTCIG